MIKCSFIALSFLLFLPCIVDAQESPVLFFSDLTSGPNSGGHWGGVQEGMGTAVTIWGENFGVSRGTNHVIVNGVELTSDNNYAEWGQNLGPARDLDRITFWIDSSVPQRSGNITISVNGQTSNELNFTVRDGNIYFVDDSGSNSNNGQYSTDQGSGSGPWQDIYMCDPQNSAMDAGDICYIRDGTYTNTEPGSIAMIRIQAEQGSCPGYEDMPIAMVGYPGEDPIAGNSGVSKFLYYQAYSSSNQRLHDWVVSKIHITTGSTAMNVWGDRWRIVGNNFDSIQGDVREGTVTFFQVKDSQFLGNLFDQCGPDEEKPDVYVQADYWSGASGYTNDCETGDTENIDYGWNEHDSTWSAGSTRTVALQIKGGELGGNCMYPHDIDVHDSYFHDGSGDAIWFGWRYDNINIYNNIFENMQADSIWGVITFLAADGQNPRPEGYQRRVYLYNNVLYEPVNDGACLVWAHASPHDININSTNNIYLSTNSEGYFNLYFFGNQPNFLSDNDLFYGEAQLPQDQGTVTFINSMSFDPLFSDPENSDFTLQLNSLAIDNGTSSISNIFQSDYLGVIRPQGSNWDIGPYEYIDPNVAKNSVVFPRRSGCFLQHLQKMQKIFSDRLVGAH